MNDILKITIENTCLGKCKSTITKLQKNAVIFLKFTYNIFSIK